MNLLTMLELDQFELSGTALVENENQVKSSSLRTDFPIGFRVCLSTFPYVWQYG
jgi:hypothetical protein